MTPQHNTLTSLELDGCVFQQTAGSVLRVTTDEVIRENVMRLMHDQRLNGSELARRAGKTASWASNYLVARKSIPLDTVDALASALRVTVAELVTPTRTNHVQGSIDAPHPIGQDYPSAHGARGEELLETQDKTVLALFHLLPQADKESVLTDMKGRLARSFGMVPASPKDQAIR